MNFVKSEDLHLCGGIVYEPNVVDSQQDWTDAAEIYKAMETFAANGFNLKKQHSETADAIVIESFQAEESTRHGGETIPKGAWYMTVKVLDDDLWALVKSGRINSFSMAGEAKTSG